MSLRTREEAVAACLALPGAYEAYPFDDPNWTAMRHGSNHKCFALIFERQGHIWINVKAEPIAALLWQQVFTAVVPAYHMNKQHWVSVILDGTMPEGETRRLILDSYRLTQPKKAAKKAPPMGEA